MCSLRPGIVGLSENIQVRSILGRYLEHSRIFFFENNGSPEVFIGSADMMHRNLDRRVETLVRIVQDDQIADLQEIMDLGMSEEVASWRLNSDGSWTRKSLANDGSRLADLQDLMMQKAIVKNSKLA
jgi:polyphosphate kinase